MGSLRVSELCVATSTVGRPSEFRVRPQAAPSTPAAAGASASPCPSGRRASHKRGVATSTVGRPSEFRVNPRYPVKPLLCRLPTSNRRCWLVWCVDFSMSYVLCMVYVLSMLLCSWGSAPTECTRLCVEELTRAPRLLESSPRSRRRRRSHRSSASRQGAPPASR